MLTHKLQDENYRRSYIDQQSIWKLYFIFSLYYLHKITAWLGIYCIAVTSKDLLE